MNRLAAIAAVAAFGTASCSGAHNAGSVLPSSVQAGGSGSASPLGTRSSRDLGTDAVPAGWAKTATRAYTLKDATDLGPLAATTPLRIRVGLQLRNLDALKSAVRSGVKLTPAAFTASYGPTAADVSAVTSYLQSQGMTNIKVEPNNLIVGASATAAQAATAFDTTLHGFTLSGKTVYANTTRAFVPAALGGIVVAVLGLNDAPAFAVSPHVGGAVPAPVPYPGSSTNASPGTPASSCSVGSIVIIGLPTPQPEPTGVASNLGCLRNYAPADYWRAYDAVDAPSGKTINVAIMAEGNVAPAIADFRVNEQGDGLEQVPVVVKPVGVASSDTAGASEWTLDMTASTGMARKVNTLYVYATTSLTDSDIALEYNRWVTDDLAPIGNSSFGGCEFSPYLDGSMVLDDEILVEGAAQGQTMFASSGDTGSFCSVGTPNGVPAGVPLVEYPAASPYVVGVGGTTLDTKLDGSYQGEAAWYAGGGGLSQFEYSPAWQNGVQPQSGTPAGVSIRGVPDIAMDADLQTGMILYTSGTGWTTIGGTSLASPLAAGVWARVLRSHANLGYAAPALYDTYVTHTSGGTSTAFPSTAKHGPYNDVILGANGAYTAKPGYDYTTGIGTLDVLHLNNHIQQ